MIVHRVDVGNEEHYAVAHDRARKVTSDKVIPNDESNLRAVIRKLKRHR